MSDENPDTAAPNQPETEATTPRRSRRLLLLATVAAAAVVALVVALVVMGQAGPGPSQAEPPSPPRPTPVAQQTEEPHPDAPRITEYVMVSEEPRTQCLEPGKVAATLEVRWTSTVDNSESEFWGYAVGRNALGSGLNSNGSHSIPVSCGLQQRMSYFIVVHDGEHSAVGEIVIEMPATPRVDDFTVTVTGGGSVADACATGGEVALDVAWATSNAENVDIDRIAQPGAVAGSVGTDVLYSSRLETAYNCAWASADYTLTVTDRNGDSVTSTVSIVR